MAEEVPTTKRRKVQAGDRFGQLLAIRPTRSESGKTWWLFLCECGEKAEKRLDQVAGGGTKTCGTCRRHTLKAGEKFSRLTAVSFHHRDGKIYFWTFKCDCGNETTTKASSVVRGKTRSCGCLQKETIANVGHKNATHGYGRTSEYGIWFNMVQRCHNPKHIGYENWGGRGIGVCERWMDPAAFIADMGLRPTNRHTIERVNNELGYSPENCVWATYHAQHRNKRTNINVEYNGQTMCLKDAAKAAGLNYSTVCKRISALGWTPQQAIMEPVNENISRDWSLHHRRKLKPT